jgi:molecular chaperone DnaK (HSP70)
MFKMVDNEKNPVLGIDLGTTFSAVARWNGKVPQHYQDRDGRDTIQSVVYFDEKNGSYIVGRLAYRRGLQQPENMVLGVKRLMDDKNQKIRLGIREHSPIEISAKILEKIYSDVAEKFPKGLFHSRGVIISVPYYFKAHQCENTREAAKLAGLNCTGILQEPIAASLSYGLEMAGNEPNKDRTELILVFDLGGGTFDLTIFELKQTKGELLFEVLGTGGDDRLGGLDFDERLLEYIVANEKVDLSTVDERTKRLARQKLMEASNQAKHDLSATTETYMAISDVIPGKHIDRQLKRAEFEACIGKYIEKIKNIVDDTFAKSGVKKADITRVIKVGGSSKIPLISQLLETEIGASKVYGNIKPDLCVAEGAAIYAAYLDDKDIFGREIIIKTRTCHALGIELAGGIFHPLIPANRKTPCQASQTFTTDKDNMTELDVNVFQGSARLVRNNAKIGTVQVRGLKPKPKGTLDITITFKVSEEQVISVTIEEPVTPIRITQSLKTA